MDTHMLRNALNITNQYAVAMDRLVALTNTSNGKFTFGTITAKSGKPCSSGPIDGDPCQVSKEVVTTVETIAVPSVNLPPYDAAHKQALVTHHTSAIHEIFANSSHRAAGVAVDSDQGQMKCPPTKLTSGSFDADSSERPEMSAVTCSEADYCIRSTACKDGTCRCTGSVILKSEQNPCASTNGGSCLTTDEQALVHQHAETIATATQDMRRLAAGGVSYVTTNATITADQYTIRFWDSASRTMQCIKVNSSACDGLTCGLTFFEFGPNTQVIGSLKDAIAGRNLHFQLNVTVLNQNFQSKVLGKLTAFNQDSLVIRDLVGAAAQYLQNNKTC